MTLFACCFLLSNIATLALRLLSVVGIPSTVTPPQSVPLPLPPILLVFLPWLLPSLTVPPDFPQLPLLLLSYSIVTSRSRTDPVQTVTAAAALKLLMNFPKLLLVPLLDVAVNSTADSYCVCMKEPWLEIAIPCFFLPFYFLIPTMCNSCYCASTTCHWPLPFVLLHACLLRWWLSHRSLVCLSARSCVDCRILVECFYPVDILPLSFVISLFSLPAVVGGGLV